MSTSKYIDRICGVVLALALVLTGVFVNAQRFGIAAVQKEMGYESRLFDTSRVHTIDIVMDDWEGFLDTCENEAYEVCAVVIDQEAYKNVGIRAKGNTSLSMVSSYGNDRYSFKIEFDHYDHSKTYYGLDKLSLNNIIQDNTYMKDYLSYQMMQGFGVSAPLCSYAAITVNGEEWGLYLAVEGVEDSFLQRNYGSSQGELYKPDSQEMGGGRGNGGGFEMDQKDETREPQDEEDGIRPGDNGQAEDSSQPGSGVQSEDGVQPGDNGQPGDGSQPGSGVQSEDGVQPGDSSQPGSGVQPGNDVQPGGSGQPGDSSQPGSGVQPRGNGQPGDSGIPVASSQPFADRIPEGEPPAIDTAERPAMPPEHTTVSGGAIQQPAAGGQEMPPEHTIVSGGAIQRKEFGGAGKFGKGHGNAGAPGSMDSKDVSLIYTDDDPDSYANIFENAKTEITEADKERLIASLKAMNAGEEIETAVDVDQVIRYFVVHNFVCNFDSYTGSMIHNYYLYEEDGQLSMIPWDYNLAFGGFQSQSDADSLVNYPIDTPVSGGEVDSRPMLAWIFGDAQYTQQYHAYFAEFIAAYFDNGYFAEMIDTVSAMIAPYVESDPTKFCTYEEFETGVDTLKAFCLLRAESIQGQLDGSIPSTAEGQAQDQSALVDASGITVSDMGNMHR